MGPEATDSARDFGPEDLSEMNHFSLSQTLRKIRASYWFVPSTMVLGALALSVVTGRLDADWSSDWLHDFDFLFDSRPEGARAVLSAIAGSMINVAGVTFSMTVVSVSFAAAQFGPRLTSNFMRDLGNQITLGVFIATFVYCLMVLRTVRNAENDSANDALAAFVPHVSILVALALALVCVGVLIYFIHHVPETINISNITASVGKQLQNDVVSIFPHSSGTDQTTPDADLDSRARKCWEDIAEGAFAVRSDATGYVEEVDLEALVASAKEAGLIAKIDARPGAFVIKGDVLLRVSAAEEPGTETYDHLRACFAFGLERTPNQNVTFLVDQLVEILARALSPGTNDPFTAISCMNWLRLGLSEMATRETPPMSRWDDDENLRVLATPVSFEEFCAAVFDQSAQYVSSDRNASIRMLEMIANIARLDISQERRLLLREYAETLTQAAEENLSAKSQQQAVRDRLYELDEAFA